MYPFEIFLGMDLYSIFLLIGVISAFAVWRICADRRNISAKLQNLVLFTAFFSVVLGYLGSVLFQAVYNFFETGIFEITKNTGATFLGGLISGAAVFLLIYFGGGAIIFRNGEKEQLTRFTDLLTIGGGCISSAHAFGRIGCFFAGCCYGKPTEAWYGIRLYDMDYNTIPVQLFESGFLFLLFGIIMFLNMKKPDFKFGLVIYTVSYGIWRYFAEYMRGDDRGEFIIKCFTPSQFSSLVIIAIGIILALILYKIYYGKNAKKATDN